MILYYKTVLRGELTRKETIIGKPTDVYEYRLLEMSEPCCPEMKEALEADAIGFGEFHDTILNRDNHLNFADCRPYEEGAVWNEYPISFCPFCGTRVETEEKEKVTLKITKRHVRQTVWDTEEVPVKE